MRNDHEEALSRMYIEFDSVHMLNSKHIPVVECDGNRITWIDKKSGEFMSIEVLECKIVRSWE